MPAKPTTDFDRWLAAAQKAATPENPLRIPFDVLIKEAGSAAAFLENRWEPTGKLPGLRRVQKRVPLKMAEEIRSLAVATGSAQTAYLLIVDPKAAEDGDRARFLVDVLESHLEFLLDDDVEEDADSQLAALQKYHADDGERSSALAQALRDYATLAKSLKDRLVENDEEFDPGWITEALALADKLAKNQPNGNATAASAAATTAGELRNGFLTLLISRVGTIRSAAKHVFRGFPDIVRESTSAYERRRRAAARRAKMTEETKTAGDKTATP
ncbi:MAG: hypothetical protein U0441_12540 [Polyangiaceae bacterium]